MGTGIDILIDMILRYVNLNQHVTKIQKGIRTRSKIVACYATGQRRNLASAWWNWPEGLIFSNPRPANRSNGAKRSQETRDSRFRNDLCQYINVHPQKRPI